MTVSKGGKAGKTVARKKHGRTTNRPATRSIVRWNEILDTRLLLNIQFACNVKGVKIPWETVSELMGQGISDGAISQHLAKLRTRMVNAGHEVPPPLSRGGGGPKAVKVIAKAGHRAKKAKGSDGSDGEYGAKNAKKGKGKAAKKNTLYGDGEDSEGDIVMDDEEIDEGEEDENAEGIASDGLVAAGASFLEYDDGSSSPKTEEAQNSKLVILKCTFEPGQEKVNGNMIQENMAQQGNNGTALPSLLFAHDANGTNLKVTFDGSVDGTQPNSPQKGNGVDGFIKGEQQPNSQYHASVGYGLPSVGDTNISDVYPSISFTNNAQEGKPVGSFMQVRQSDGKQPISADFGVAEVGPTNISGVHSYVVFNNNSSNNNNNNVHGAFVNGSQEGYLVRNVMQEEQSNGQHVHSVNPADVEYRTQDDFLGLLNIKEEDVPTPYSPDNDAIGFNDINHASEVTDGETNGLAQHEPDFFTNATYYDDMEKGFEWISGSLE
ncbi:hypothetical protein AJ80_02806 [Polytolypa hystricis UAMH7299]|uniref:Myb-like domain-containing protein n=1 Tax=Polytolypa hystricis (strain UAMH7299) TaxID=1447883 RepID=A0A2B7YQ50_POLH7|nr:hypothetical protein AJ80_02806 [Polytolypa hystricis UAMH7299]